MDERDRKAMNANSQDLYHVKEHGLMFIVYEVVWGGFDFIHIEDSRWTSRKKAEKHCKLLNDK